MLWGRWVPQGASFNNRTVTKVKESWKAIRPETLFTHRWFTSCGGVPAQLQGYLWGELGRRRGNMTKGSDWLFVKIIDSLKRGTLTLGLMIRHIDGKSIFHVCVGFYSWVCFTSTQRIECLFPKQLKHSSTFGFKAQRQCKFLIYSCIKKKNKHNSYFL